MHSVGELAIVLLSALFIMNEYLALKCIHDIFKLPHCAEIGILDCR